MCKEKIFVIGSNSFSGSNFVTKALKKGYKVMGISRSSEPAAVFLPYKWIEHLSKEQIEKDFIFRKFDLNNDLKEIIESLDSFMPDYVVNFAAQGMVAESWLNPTHWYKTNVVSQVALHDELRKRTFLKKYLHVTTPEVYGSTDSGWINEKQHFSPSTPYAVSRASCDMHLISFYKAYDFPVVFTRAANVFGPGQQLYRIIPRTILSSLTGRKMKLHGGGYSSRSFIHIDDVVRATLKLALEGKPGNTWHISTNKIISIRSLVKLICNLTNAKFEDIVEIDEERLGKDKNYLLNSESLRKEFNWNDNILLENGIMETINWVETNMEKMISMKWDYVHKV